MAVGNTASNTCSRQARSSQNRTLSFLYWASVQAWKTGCSRPTYDAKTLQICQWIGGVHLHRVQKKCVRSQTKSRAHGFSCALYFCPAHIWRTTLALCGVTGTAFAFLIGATCCIQLVDGTHLPTFSLFSVLGRSKSVSYHCGCGLPMARTSCATLLVDAGSHGLAESRSNSPPWLPPVSR